MNIEIHAQLKSAGKKAQPVKIVIKRRQLKSIVEQILANRLKNIMIGSSDSVAPNNITVTRKRGPYKKRNKAVIASPITV